MGYRQKDYGEGRYSENVKFPLERAETIADLDAYVWPSPDWYDYSALPDIASFFPDRAIACGYVSMTYYAYQLRNLENSLIDPMLRPEFTRHMLGRMSEFFTECHTRCFEAARGMIQITQLDPIVASCGHVACCITINQYEYSSPSSDSKIR